VTKEELQNHHDQTNLCQTFRRDYDPKKNQKLKIQGHVYHIMISHTSRQQVPQSRSYKNIMSTQTSPKFLGGIMSKKKDKKN